jgi:hypothetical protein
MTLFNNKFHLYIYININNVWGKDSYKKIYTIESYSDFWKIYNNYSKIGGLLKNNIFLMKNDIYPLWEEKENINGGCWTYKIHISKLAELWEDLSCYFVNNILCPEIPDEINGLTICIKKNNLCLIKIWNSDAQHNSLNYINKKIIDKWGINIIYIVNIINTA